MTEFEIPQSRPHIVFVEDDAVLADITAFRLELLGYYVQTYHNAETALTAIFERLPDVVIVDLNLPGMSGLDLLERLSSDEATSELPAMAISTDAELEMVQRAYLAGAVDYLVVPYNPEVLETKVETLVARTGKHA